MKELFKKLGTVYERTNAELVLSVLKRQVVDERPDGRLVPQPRWIKYGSRVLLSIIEESDADRTAILDGIFTGNRGELAEQVKKAGGCRRPRARRKSAARVRFRVRRARGIVPERCMTDKPPKAEDVAPVVYDELRRVAAAYMRRERPGQTLQATALVHEAYLRLAQAGTPWHDQRHFVGIAARSMRQILVERARARGAQKRWGGMNRVSITDSLPLAADPETMLPALDEAINKLEQLDAEQAKIVELRYFAGMSVEEAADVMGMSPATLKRRWSLARAWLFRELSQ